jgi:N-acetylglucosaminyl-diphospho-decaprenol L-rhamnosyltransferase
MSAASKSTESVELSIVLVNHNGAGCLPATLAALKRNTEAQSVECIVVDSGSRDGSWRGVDAHWTVARALRYEENIGFCAGCNRGAAAARGSLLAFVNFDGRVEPGWDAPLRALLAEPDVAVATGLLLREDGVELEAAGLAIAPNMATYGRREAAPRSAAPSSPVGVTAASGALMMVRRDDFRAMGGFWEELFMYGEEADYCLRADGRVVLDPRSALRHSHGHAAGPHHSDIRLYFPSRNRLLNAARHLPAPAVLRSVIASAVFDLLTLAMVRRRSAVRAVLRGWRDGLREMPRQRRTRSPAEKRRAARRLVSLRVAVRELLRLRRL